MHLFPAKAPPPIITPGSDGPITANASDKTPPVPKPDRVRRSDNQLPVKKIIVFAGGLILVLFVISLVKTIIAPGNRNQPTLPEVSLSPSPDPQSATPSQTDTPTEYQPEQINRLPVTSITDHQIIAAIGDQLWQIDFTRDGLRKTLLVQNNDPIIALSLSPTKQKVAFAYSSGGGTGLKILDFKDKSVTEFISPGETPLRYLSWSNDGLYLAFWQSGLQSSLFDMTTKRRLLDISTGSGNVGPIVFVPGQAKISYVSGTTLYESEYTGNKKVEILKNISGIRPNGLPDLHMYSSNGLYITHHNTLGQLVLFQKNDPSQQVLAEGQASPYQPYGEAIMFDAFGNLIYTNTGKETYIPGIDDNPLYVLNLKTKVIKPFYANRKTPLVLSDLLPDLAKQRLLIRQNGFTVFMTNGPMVANCDYTNFDPDLPDTLVETLLNSPLRVWSTDSKYILSNSTVQIANVTTCAITAPIDTQSFDRAVWLK